LERKIRGRNLKCKIILKLIFRVKFKSKYFKYSLIKLCKSRNIIKRNIPNNRSNKSKELKGFQKLENKRRIYKFEKSNKLLI
jgi:hypothetical protein